MEKPARRRGGGIGEGLGGYFEGKKTSKTREHGDDDGVDKN